MKIPSYRALISTWAPKYLQKHNTFLCARPILGHSELDLLWEFGILQLSEHAAVKSWDNGKDGAEQTNVYLFFIADLLACLSGLQYGMLDTMEREAASIHTNFCTTSVKLPDQSRTIPAP